MGSLKESGMILEGSDVGGEKDAWSCMLEKDSESLVQGQ